jgi:hypothetical protein
VPSDIFSRIVDGFHKFAVDKVLDLKFGELTAQASSKLISELTTRYKENETEIRA